MQTKKHYFFVYIISNHKRTVLYIGITSNLIKRIWENKKGKVSGFSTKYHVNDLLYYEVFSDPLSAIEREKQLKRWSRKKKNTLIAGMNPTLKDLYPTII